jgi:hypothetical protein
MAGSGVLAVVGGYNDNSGVGAFWTFARSSTTSTIWFQTGSTYTPSNANGAAAFGYSVSLSQDGSTLAVGGPYDNNNIGATWIYVNYGTGFFSYQAKLIGTKGGQQQPNGQQGFAVAISGNGNLLAVGSPYVYIEYYSYPGFVIIFQRSGTSWTQLQLVNGLDAQKIYGIRSPSVMGWSLAMAPSGNYFVAGAPQYDSNQGFLQLFYWNGQQYIYKSFIRGTGGIGAPQLGWSVAISSDGSIIAAGGYGDNNNVGAVWIFVHDTNDLWTQRAKLVGTNSPTQASYQGYSVAITADGSLVLFGAPNDNSQNGAIWAFASSNGGLNWAQQGGKITGTGNAPPSYLGQSLALSSYYPIPIFGTAGQYDRNGAGAVWFFQTISTTPQPTTNKPTISPTTSSPTTSPSTKSPTTHAPLPTQRPSLQPSTLSPVVSHYFVFMTHTAWTPGSGTTGADAVCLSEVTSRYPLLNSAHGGALLSGSTVVSSWDTTKNVYGAGTGAYIESALNFKNQATLSNALSSYLDLSSGDLSHPFYWTGLETGFVVAPITCNGWVGTTGQLGEIGYVAYTNQYLSATSDGCDATSPPKLFCAYLSPFPPSHAPTQSPSNSPSTPKPSISPTTSPTLAPTGTPTYDVFYPYSQQAFLQCFPYGYSANTGTSVAMSGDGMTLAIGAPYYSGYSTQTGGVCIMTNDGYGNWFQQGSPLIGTQVNFGISVGISNDGNVLVVGYSSYNNGIGAAFVYTRNGSVWDADNPTILSLSQTSVQGFSVAMSSDGKTIVYGAPGDNSGLGAAWVFMNVGGVWKQQGPKLVGTGFVGSNVRQGEVVTISGDGKTIASSGYQDNNEVGAVWVFTKNSTGGWNQQGSKITAPSDTNPNYFGEGVAFSYDGNTMAVSVQSTYAAWIYHRSHSGTWDAGTGIILQATSSPTPVGYSVALSYDASVLSIGLPADDNDVGGVWVLRNISGNYMQQGTGFVGTPIFSGLMYQGYSVSMSSDGTLVASGGPQWNNQIGAAWVFGAILPTSSPTVPPTFLPTSMEPTSSPTISPSTPKPTKSPTIVYPTIAPSDGPPTSGVGKQEVSLIIEFFFISVACYVMSS